MLTLASPWIEIYSIDSSFHSHTIIGFWIRETHPFFMLKQFTGRLVVRWVTTGEYPLSYVFCFVFLCKLS
ncbi:hypothetical protein COCSADRAFT_224821 [Bipolaris sorokiniana ND90Pr]|uniref:Uncharacterized protein n=1 Tax=Cochliobolus sativus (strain ND90Pr / ATCC 201652) TaxID=665912 RepID=M2SYF5_COCSN|nr:hypothetical protein COCSADRAFT_224821 [Bipolaris sorokiniana ND90Pr]